MMYNYLWGSQAGFSVFGSLASILMVIVLALAIAALWKYINKK